MTDNKIVILDETSEMGKAMAQFITVITKHFREAKLPDELRLMLIHHAWMINFTALFPPEFDEKVIDLSRELLAGYRLASTNLGNPAQPN